jgi:hypothetical protein
MEHKALFETSPAWILPGYRMMQALRVPPSKPVPLASRNGVVPE